MTRRLLLSYLTITTFVLLVLVVPLGLTFAGRERALATYGARMKDDLGGYYTLGRVFVKLIEHPQVMRVCTRYGLPRPTIMKLTHKLLADCYEPHGGDWADRTIAALARLAPAS